MKPIITHPLRRPLTALLMLLALALVPGSKVPAQAATTQRPNIVFILVDDAGFSDFGAYGSEIATPNIDSLANEGLRFTNFHTAPTCEATRVMLHSGVDHHLAGAGTLSVVIAENQKGKPGYEGYLSDRVHSLGLGVLCRETRGFQSLDLCIARAGAGPAGRGKREKCAGKVISAVDAGAVTLLRGDRYVGANAARRWRSGHRPAKRCFTRSMLSAYQ